jgi:FolB domain-containing protein
MNQTELIVSNLNVQCIIGVWAHEKLTPQRLGVDLRLLFDGTAAGATDDLSNTINYAQLTETMTFVLQQGAFELLETASQMLWSYLMIDPLPSQRTPSVSFAEVTLTKFDALAGNTLAKIVARGDRVDRVPEQETHSWGTVDIALENKKLGIYRLNIGPGKMLPLHHHEIMQESEFILDEGLILIQPNKPDRALKPGDQFQWSAGEVHGYYNSSDQWASILCMDTPPFLPSDEVLCVK